MDSSNPLINSLRNPRVKQAIKLREGRARRKAGKFLIDGVQEIIRAAVHGFHLDTVFVSALKPPEAELVEAALAAKTKLLPVTPAILERLSYGNRNTSPVAVAITPHLSLDKLQLASNSLVLVMDRIEKPGNLGACLRTAAACEVTAVVITNPICELFNPNTIRASRGAVFTLPLAVCTTDELLQLALGIGLPAFAARVDAEQGLWQCDFRRGAAIVFGGEADGLGEDWNLPNIQNYRIPMCDRVDSLNVSISAAVSLYEAMRQRSATKN